MTEFDLRLQILTFFITFFPQTDLGNVKTSDQKVFIINGVGKFNGGSKVSVNFFLKFDELEDVPNVKRVFIDSEQVCVKGKRLIEQSGNFITTTTSETDTSTDATPTRDYTDIKLGDLPFANFSNVTEIPSTVDNVGREEKQAILCLFAIGN